MGKTKKMNTGRQHCIVMLNDIDKRYRLGAERSWCKGMVFCWLKKLCETETFEKGSTEGFNSLDADTKNTIRDLLIEPHMKPKIKFLVDWYELLDSNREY